MNFRRFSRKLVLAAAILAVGAMALGLMAAPGQAAINKKGAQQLKKMFETVLQEQQAAAIAQGGSIQMDGEVLVEPSDKYYAITLPHLLIKQMDGSSVDIGMIAMNALPTDKKGQWKMTMALPTPIVWHGADGKKKITIDIGRQNFAGIWHEEYKTYVKAQANYQDIRITSSDGTVNVTVGGMKAVTDLNEAANGKWSGPGTFTVSNLHVSGGAEGSFRIGTLEGRTDIYDYDMKAAETYRQNLQTLAESYKSGDASTTPQHAAGMYNMFTGFLGAVWDGFDSQMTLRDMQYEHAATATSPARSLRLGEQSLHFSLKGFHQQAVSLRLAAGYNGIAVTPAPEYAQTMPDRARIDLEINKLPYKEIVALGRTAVESGAQTPQNGQMLAMQTLMTLPQLLTQAGTNITLKEFSLGNPQYSAHGKGVLTADMQALKGATGTGTVEIAGIENLITLVQGQLKLPANAAPPQQEKLNKLLSTLTLIQMLGQQGTGADGKPARLYNFELTKDGKILLNGTDLGMLTQQSRQ